MTLFDIILLILLRACRNEKLSVTLERSFDMKKPIIGVTPLFSDKINKVWMLPCYTDAIWHAGGIPVILPLSQKEEEIDELARKFDGFLFTGGHDIDPAMYGEEKLPFCKSTSAYRDNFEKILFEKTLKYKKPVFAICRGFQFMNVVLGGSLYQDIEMQMVRVLEIPHLQEKPYEAPAHSIKLTPSTPISNLADEDVVMVNTIHHQSIRTLASSLCVAATAPDDIIEAVYMPSEAFVVGVQWHPEFTYQNDKFSSELFKAFVGVCSV